jgi:NAD(P)-dependent dehydrogenase (short-subunit alcohol dehydrogenase family)
LTAQHLKGRIALITGASRGLGRAIALAFAREGAHVLLLARGLTMLGRVDDEIRAAGGTASLVPLDLANGQAIDALGPSLYERFGRLDAFVGSAATLDPLLRRSDAARVIFVTSSVAHSARAYWAPYSVSKAALEALVRTYANETAGTPIRVNLVDPGAMATRMRAEAYPGEDQALLASPEQVTEIFVKIAMVETEATGRIFTPEPQAS